MGSSTDHPTNVTAPSGSERGMLKSGDMICPTVSCSMNSSEKRMSEGADSYAAYPVLEQNLIGVIYGVNESSEETDSGDRGRMVDGKGD